MAASEFLSLNTWYIAGLLSVHFPRPNVLFNCRHQFTYIISIVSVSCNNVKSAMQKRISAEVIVKFVEISTKRWLKVAFAVSQ